MKIDLKRHRVGRCRTGSSGSGYGQVADSCEHGKEHPGPKKRREFIV